MFKNTYFEELLQTAASIHKVPSNHYVMIATGSKAQTLFPYVSIVRYGFLHQYDIIKSLLYMQIHIQTNNTSLITSSKLVTEA